MPLYRGPWSAPERGTWRCPTCGETKEADDFRCDCTDDANMVGCDICGELTANKTVVCYGIDTTACDKCRGLGA